MDVRSGLWRKLSTEELMFFFFNYKFIYFNWRLITLNMVLVLPYINMNPPRLSESFPMSQLFAWGVQSIGVSALALVLPMNTLDWSPLEWLVGSPCSPTDSQESSPTPQFKSINSSVFSFLHSPTLTSIHDHWKNHSLDQMDLCWQSNVSAFEYAI